jgi:hypothetical protein
MNRNRKITKYLVIALCSIAFQTITAFAQNEPTPTPPKTPKIYAPKTAPRTQPRRAPVHVPRPRPLTTEREDSEKSIVVDGKVNIFVPCVLEGNVKINGWDRNEVRIFIQNGSPIGYVVREKNKQNGNPAWIEVLGYDPAKNQERRNECLYGGEIEIDVPRNASISVKGRETRMTIDSVRRATVKTAGGDISLRNIDEGVEALTYEGDVSVENSGGAITLESATGNILAYETAPSEIGDIFRAKTTNGAIALQGLEHRQIEVNSISGSISYNGGFLGGGVYNFGTSNGAINLAIPKDSSCKVNASYGFGGFNSEIPIDKTIENKSSRGQNIIGTMGNGNASLNLTTASGAIRIRGKK